MMWEHEPTGRLPSNRLPARTGKNIRRAKRADKLETEEFGESSENKAIGAGSPGLISVS